MKIPAFETEHFFSRYEFSAPYLLSVSDCESMTLKELLDLAGVSLDEFGRQWLGYTESQGLPALREAIAAACEGITAAAVVVLNSPVEGIYVTMRALLGPTDEAVILTPCYDTLLNLTTHICGRVRQWRLEPAKGKWELDLDALDRLLTSRTRLVGVNFPHNPTGFLPSEDLWRALVDRLRSRGIWLFSDEMYRGLEPQGTSTLPSACEMYERSIVLSGLSKAFGLPGLRCGWVIVPDRALRDDLINWKYYTSICPPAPSERLALAALSIRDELVRRSRTRIAANLALAEPFFERWRSFFDWRAPQAGPVALAGIDVPSATRYCHSLASTQGIVLLPAAFMHATDDHVRFGFGRAGFAEALSRYDEVLTGATE
jgi:aspartate/methionine/tyrosine aminotransferase